jgi:hypothetical protein
MKIDQNYKLIKVIACTIITAFSYLLPVAQQLYDSLLTVSGTNYPQEKIYLHLDKSYYNKGETIWFKAYITENNVPSQISKTMYAELLNEAGTVLQRKTMPILQSGAASFFELDANYTSPVYIRAYTSWMLNFDSSLLYIKPVTIINTTAPAKKTTPAYTLSLFPEGGDLIETINCRIAFKTNNEEGIPFAVSGNVVDGKGTKITSFSSVHDGMGYFTFTPWASEKYKAVWKDPEGKLHETPLPEIKMQGAALRISYSKGHLMYTINRPDSADDVFKTFAVVAQMQQQTVYAATINMQHKTQVSASIVTDSMPDGILQLTLFNASQVPVAERLVFINNNSYYFNTDLHLIEKNILPHGKNVLQIDVGENFLSNLSVSVTDGGLNIDGKSKENIFTELLLSSDLKGNVYNPAYYFSSDADSVQQQLDLVMITNGWRRYKWQDMLSGRWPKLNHLPDDYLTVKGNVFGLPAVQLKNKELSIILKTATGNTSFLFAPLTLDGKFKLSGLYFFDTAKLYYQINNDKEKRLTSSASFSFTNGFEQSPNSAFNVLAALYVNPGPDALVLQKSIKQNALSLSAAALQKTKTLQSVVVTAKQKSLKDKLEEQYTSGLFSGGFARTFTTEDDPFASSAISILDYLQGKVAGLQISTQGEGSVTRRGSATDVFLNETHTEISVLQSTPMSDVAMIKVFDPPFFGAAGGGAGGAVAVYTKKGSNTANVKGLNEAKIAGYSALKEFYMPDYEKSKDLSIADYRTTLYWNPFILMDAKNRRVTIPFYNSDNCKKIKVVIEGLNENGQLTREEKIFE